MIETRSVPVNTRGTQQSKEESSSLSSNLLYAAALKDLSGKMAQSLESTTTDPVEPTPEETTQSLRSAIEQMAISLEMSKVYIAEAQSERTNAVVTIDDAVRNQILNDYSELLKQLEEKKGLSKLMKKFGKVSDVFGISMSSICALAIGAVTGPVGFAIAAGLVIMDASGGSKLLNEGLQKGFQKMGIPEGEAKLCADITQIAMVSAAAGGSTKLAMGAAGRVTNVSTMHAMKSLVTGAQGASTAARFATIAGASQISSTQVCSSIIDLTVPEGETREWLKFSFELVAGLGAAWVMGANTNAIMKAGAPVAKTVDATADVVDAAATTKQGKAAEFLMEANVYATILGGIGESVSSIGSGVSQIKMAQVMMKQSEVMSRLSIMDSVQDSNENDVADTTEHYKGLLDVHYDYTGFSQPGKALTKALS